MEIKITRAEVLKEKPDQSNLGFGRHFTDHMFTMDWTKEEGWHNAQIVPYGPIEMNPACMVLHYAQETFEGLKAYRKGDDILLFRPEMNARRLRKSNERLCMAQLPEEMFIEAVEAIVKYEKDWVPSAEGTSLYIRPFCFATESGVGVHPAISYKFIIIFVISYSFNLINRVKYFCDFFGSCISSQDTYLSSLRIDNIYYNLLSIIIINLNTNRMTCCFFELFFAIFNSFLTCILIFVEPNDVIDIVYYNFTILFAYFTRNICIIG